MASIRFDPAKARPLGRDDDQPHVRWMTADAADRLADDRAEAAIQMLLDGLGVESIDKLKRLVDERREIEGMVCYYDDEPDYCAKAAVLR